MWFDTADAKTLAKESKFCLVVLAELDSLVHSSYDVSFGQELVHDELTGSHSNSEGVAPSGHCGDRGQQAHLVDFPLGRGRVQVR